MRLPLLVLLSALAVGGCAHSRVPDPSSTEGPQTVEALRDLCESLIPGPGLDAVVSLDTIERRVDLDDEIAPTLSMGTDAFKASSESAEATWWYNDADDFGGMMTGEGGLIATKGCTVIAQETIVIYN